jgi:hypothetical protein
MNPIPLDLPIAIGIAKDVAIGTFLCDLRGKLTRARQSNPGKSNHEARIARIPSKAKVSWPLR